MNIPPVTTFGNADVRLVEEEHDPRTCAACADVASAEERASWADAPARGPGLRVRRRRYRTDRPSVVLSVRLDRDEWEAVSAAAERAGTYVSAYVRAAVVDTARS